MGVMQPELQISKEMPIWDGSFKYVGEAGEGVGRPYKTFKGGFHLEPHVGFHLDHFKSEHFKLEFKLEHLYFFYPS